MPQGRHKATRATDTPEPSPTPGPHVMPATHAVTGRLLVRGQADLPRSWLFAVLLWASDLTHLLAHVMNVTGEESPAAQEWISLQAKVVEGMGGCTTATLRNPVKFSLDWTIWILESEACRHGDRRNIMPTSTKLHPTTFGFFCATEEAWCKECRLLRICRCIYIIKTHAHDLCPMILFLDLLFVSGIVKSYLHINYNQKYIVVKVIVFEKF